MPLIAEIGSGGWILIIAGIAAILYLLVSTGVRLVRSRRSDDDE